MAHLLGGIDEMEEVWRDLGPGDASASRDDVLNTGREAYLRTKQMLDEAATVSSMLFLDEGDMSQRYRKAYDREDALDGAPAADASEQVPQATNPASASFGSAGSLFFRATSEPGTGSGFPESGGGGILAAAAAAAGVGHANVPVGAVERRPEEKLFCDALLDLQSLTQRLPPGERAQPDQIFPIVRKMHGISSGAEAAAADSAARLRELQGSGSPAVAVAAATAHELSLEKDTWSLLLMMNAADKDDAAITEEARRRGGSARGGRDFGGDGDGDDDPLPFPPPGPEAPDEDVLHLMRIRDSEFRRTEAVVQWLQDATSSRLGGLAPAEGMVRGGRVGWDKTLQSLAVGGGQKSEVSQMHPDANIRKVAGIGGGGGNGGGGDWAEGAGGALKVLRLAGQDDLDEEELLRTVWMLVRAGKLRRAQRMCEDRGQPWRAAAMAGGVVVGSRDEENYEMGEEKDEEGDRVVYLPGQAMWQEMCWQLSVSLERGANNSEGPSRSVAKHEAAVFAHLAGNAELLLGSDLTQSWEDQAWVRFTTLLHLKVLRERISHRRVQAALSSLYPGVATLRTDERLLELMMQSAPPTSHGSIFEVLDDNSRGRVRAEGKGVYRQAQQALVLGERDIPLFLRNILWRVANGGAASVGDEGQGGEGEGGGRGAAPRMFCSPQLLRFAAHLALLLAAQCPYLTMEDETAEAIEDVVCAYAQHLATTQQVRLVAVYAATLPTLRRRELYAGFLRGLEGDGDRREALELAERHMGGDVQAILKKVVEDVRLQTPSVAPRVPRQVPEGDLKKIKAVSWLLDHPGARGEAVVQANALARHLMLQEYQVSVIGGLGSANGGGGASHGAGALPWATPPEDSAEDEGMETPALLSARAEAVGKLLAAVAQNGGQNDDHNAAQSNRSGPSPEEVEAKAEEEMEGIDADAAREHTCWALLLEARAAYLEWVSARRAREQDEDEDRRRQQRGGRGALELRRGPEAVGDELVHGAAVKAMDAMERVLTFEDGWMYPQDPTANLNPTASTVATEVSSSTAVGSWIHVSMRGVAADDGGAGGVTGGDMVMSFPSGGHQGSGDGDGGVSGKRYRTPEDRRKAKEVAEARGRRAREERASVARAAEAARCAEAVARREELLRVREACLPGLVFLTHEVAHGTGLWMLQWGSADVAREWFVRGQTVANTVAKDEHRTWRAMSQGHMIRLLQCVERSSTKVLEYDEGCAV